MLTRRATLFASAAALALPSAVKAESAFPDRPLRLLVPFGPGGLADLTARIVMETVGERLGQQVVIINQPGAGGISAARAVLAAPADGHTLALFTNGTAISVSLLKTLPYDPVADFAPVAGVGTFDFLFVVQAKGAYRRLEDIVAAAKTKPGALNVGTISAGSSQHLSAVLFQSLAGVDATVVAYRTSPDAITALIRGELDFIIDGYAATRAMLASGELRALAMSGAMRSPTLPDVPTAVESGVANFDVTSWNAVFARVATPPAIVARLNAAIGDALSDATVKQRLLDLGIVARPGTAAEAGDRLRADIAKWAAVIERAGIAKQ